MNTLLTISLALLALIGTSKARDNTYAHNNCEDPNYFDCGNGQCTRAEYVCDFRRDCANSADEADCPSREQCNHRNQYKCGDGKCIPKIQTCDLLKDCDDDETKPSLKCKDDCTGPHQFRCSSVADPTNHEYCLELDSVCDGHDDCPEGEDEQNCPSLTYSSSTRRPNRCENATYFDCGNGQCTEPYNECDFKLGCDNFADETNCPSKEECSHENQFKCKDGRCLKAIQVCDTYKDCSDGDDEPDSCPQDCSGPHQLRCTSLPEDHRLACMDLDSTCDTHNDCPNGEDEAPQNYCPSLTYDIVG